MNAGIAIRKLRKERCANMSQNEFATMVKISQTYLSQIESGKKTPKIEILRRISIALKIPLPIIFWLSLEDCDIIEFKKENFRFLKPTVDAMINEFY
jgi:transcriptional regulator with XRE-family HTH domain